MQPLLVFLAMTATAASDGDPTIRLVTGRMAELRDVTFVYEGQIRLIGPERIIGKRPEGSERQFQGIYTTRGDGAMRLDLYSKGSSLDHPLLRIKHAYLRGSAEQVITNPDTKLRAPKPRKSPADPGSLNMPGYAHRFFYAWYFLELADVKDNIVETIGKEVVGGHECLIVKVRSKPEPPPSIGSSDVLWFDMARGGHPLQVEHYIGSDLLIRMHDIELKEVATEDGKRVWLPIHGVTDTFGWGKGYHTEPIYREVYHVVDGTIRINRGLGDDFFSLAKEVRQIGDEHAPALGKEYS